jgi:hypothetical protein
MRLLEILSRTRLQVFTFTKGSSKDFPEGAGSGFILKYKNKLIFVTADHVIHPLDHEKKCASQKDATWLLQIML